MKILNLYSGLGGNRKLWGSEHEITAIENCPDIAETYSGIFPNDIVIVTDARSYLLDNYKKFDFVWSSPPCQTHGQYRKNVGVEAKGYAAVFPDLSLYEQIIFLKHHFKGSWVVENVIPYYEPIIKPTVKIQRHLFWCNFNIPFVNFTAKGIRTKNKISDYDDLGVDLQHTKIKNKRQALRNCVDSDLGLHVFNSFLESRLFNEV